MALEAGLAARLAVLRERICRAAERAGRDPATVRLVAASKRQPSSSVVAAVRAGLCDFGENYVQEAAAKAEQIQTLYGDALHPLPRWHLIGTLQRNKARRAAELFSSVHSVDRLAVAEALSRAAERIGRELPILIQVNLSAEPQKGGSAEAALPEFLVRLTELPHLRAVGLMTVPAAHPDPEMSRPFFARLRQLLHTLRERPGGAGLRELSMGMSSDLEVAVEEGATSVRVGTALFGARKAIV